MISRKIVRAFGQEVDSAYLSQTRKSLGLAIFVTICRHFDDVELYEIGGLYTRLEKSFYTRKSRRQKSGRSFQSLLFFTTPIRMRA